jgi:hypothetical protein
MADLEDEILKAGYRLAALEIILIDLMASMPMAGPGPVKAAEAYRERFRNMLAQNPEPHEPDASGYSEFVSGERADAVDMLLEKVVGTVRKRAARKASP